MTWKTRLPSALSARFQPARTSIKHVKTCNELLSTYIEKNRTVRLVAIGLYIDISVRMVSEEPQEVLSQGGLERHLDGLLGLLWWSVVLYHDFEILGIGVGSLRWVRWLHLWHHRGERHVERSFVFGICRLRVITPYNQWQYYIWAEAPLDMIYVFSPWSD
jgi:hypothetical protein